MGLNLCLGREDFAHPVRRGDSEIAEWGGSRLSVGLHLGR